MARQQRTFIHEFKLQLVNFYKNKKSLIDIAREYNITPSTLDC
ncbi:TPA: transposase [Bacillus paranthracis]|nr:transposase [Bacillus paranthracis]HDR7306526.1 transposase [Bacillus paranthracis]